MGEMIIRLDDEALQNDLNKLAQAHDRAPELEALELLRAAVARRLASHNRKNAAKRIAGMTPAGIRQSNSIALIREDRNR